MFRVRRVFSPAPSFLAVPAQPSNFEAEAELDTRIMLTWLWPVQESITRYELSYWEANSDIKVGVLGPAKGGDV